MSGKASRSKGIRGELNLRNEFIKLGYESRRVPLSGSMQGYKGDVVFAKEGKEYTAEVKVRKDGFKSLYTHLDTEGLRYLTLVDGTCVSMSYHLSDVMSHGIETFCHTTQRLSNKLIAMRKWLQNCNILCVKNDRKPFIYIRYLG